MSGRRSRRSEGRPAGTWGRATSSVRALPRGMAWGLFPNRMLSWFSFWPIWRSRSGILAPAVCTRASAWATSSLDTMPRSWRSPTRRREAWKDFRVALGDFQLAVQGAQLEVGPGHVGHHRGPHRSLRPLGGQGLGLGGFGQVPEAPEQVDLPEEIKVELGQAVHDTDPLRDGRVDAGLAQFFPLPQGRAAYLGEPQGAAHPHQGPGFRQPGHSLADVVVLRQRGADEVLEGRVAENLPPGKISQGVKLRPGLTLTGLEAVLLGHLPGGALVPGDAAGKQQSADEEKGPPLHERPPSPPPAGPDIGGLTSPGAVLRPASFSCRVTMA